MHQKFVVQVEPEEEWIAVPIEVSEPSPVVVKPEPLVQPRPRQHIRVDIEQVEREQRQRVQELLREDVLKKTHESVVINKPRGVGVPPQSIATAQEDAFRRIQLPNLERIERLYQPQSTKSKRSKPTTFWQGIRNKATRIIGRAGRGKNFLWSLGLGVVVLLVISVGFFWLVKTDVQAAEKEARSLVEDIQQSRISSARERVADLQRKRSRYVWLFNRVQPIFVLAQGRSKALHIAQLLEVSDSGLHLAEVGLDSYAVLDQGYRQFLSQEDGKSTETFTKVSGKLEVLFTELSSLQAKLQRLNNPYHLAAIDEFKNELNDRMPHLRKYFLSAKQLTYVLPEILGENGHKKQYLILLQNNAELRPTGGFIGSFALLTVENGKFLDFRVEDVYEADGQLNGFVAPPEEITQYLGEAQWFLRDVNWSPDFPTVAQQAGWFLDKELKIKPDGVIGINLSVVKKMLEVSGPIRLVDYDEVITKDNLYERAQQHAELNFFPDQPKNAIFSARWPAPCLRSFSARTPIPCWS